MSTVNEARVEVDATTELLVECENDLVSLKAARDAGAPPPWLPATTSLDDAIVTTEAMIVELRGRIVLSVLLRGILN